MAAKDLGTKHTCFKCGVKFYDLKKPEPLCPKCGADQREAKESRSSEKPERKRAARPPAEEPEVTEEVLEEEEGLIPDEDEDEEPAEDEVDEG